MKDKFFLDTNIFIYSFDSKNPKKKKISEKLVSQALSTGAGAISWQVVQEFLNAAQKKFAIPLKTNDCKVYLTEVLSPLCVVFPNSDLYKRALEIHEKTQFSYYDSLIVTSALEAGCEVLYSEDMQSGRLIDGLKIKNPFL